MYKKINSLLLWLLILLQGLITTPSYAASGTSLGTMASDVMEPLAILRYMLDAGSVMIGLFLITASFSRYLRHRRNPQESPLGTVIFWLLLGIVLVVLPILYRLSMLASVKTGAVDAVF